MRASEDGQPSSSIRIGEIQLRVEATLPERRCAVAPFRAESSASEYVVREVGALPAGLEPSVLDDGAEVAETEAGELLVVPREGETPLVMGLLIAAARRGALVFHSSAVQVRGRAVLAVGTSGAGKSTLATFAEPYPLLSDEFNVVWRRDGELVASATPLRSSSPREPNNLTAPLGAILFPVKAGSEFLVPVPPDKAIEPIAQQAVTPQVFGLRPPFRLIAELARAVPAYEFHFRKDPACVELFDALKLAGE